MAALSQHSVLSKETRESLDPIEADYIDAALRSPYYNVRLDAIKMVVTQRHERALAGVKIRLTTPDFIEEDFDGK